MYLFTYCFYVILVVFELNYDYYFSYFPIQIFIINRKVYFFVNETLI